jgi:branched-chain amino acid transport system substrate-binding protein
VKLKTCFIRQAEEEGQRCGQLMANDKNVSVIVFGGVFVGNQSFYGVLKGKKPVIIGVSASPVDGNQKNVFALLGDQPHVLGPWGTFARDVLKAKTAAVLYQNEPGAIPAANATKKGLEDAGIKVTSVGFDPNLTDLLGPLTAAGGQTADVIVPMTAFVHCPKIATALQQIGSTKPVVANPLCIFGPGASYPGGDIPKNWVLGFAQANTAVQTPDVKAYLTTSTRNGLKREDAIQVFAALGWSEILAVVRFMNGIGADNITPAEIATVARAFRGPVIMGPPSIRCGQFKQAIAICNDQTQFYQYQGQGQWKRVSGWLKPPK